MSRMTTITNNGGVTQSTRHVAADRIVLRRALRPAHPVPVGPLRGRGPVARENTADRTPGFADGACGPYVSVCRRVVGRAPSGGIGGTSCKRSWVASGDDVADLDDEVVDEACDPVRGQIGGIGCRERRKRFLATEDVAEIRSGSLIESHQVVAEGITDADEFVDAFVTFEVVQDQQE